MASKAAKSKLIKRKVKIANGKMSAVKHRNRCEICGRPRGYIRMFKMCRICFRNRALNAQIPGVTKATW